MTHRHGGLALASYLALFALLFAPWLASLTRAIPGEWLPDSVLIVWVLAWVAHSLATCPTQLFAAPINYPAPLQLTGSEHFASSQLLFGPFFYATGNAVLAANSVVLLSYPVAAFAMQRLGVALGCRDGVAWVVGLLFALGPLRVPATLQVVQYMNLFLPLAALAMIRLRAHSTARRACTLGVILTLGAFSSYYMAILLAVAAGVVGLVESVRAGVGRGRFIAFALGAGAASALLLVAVSRPYREVAAHHERIETVSETEVWRLASSVLSTDSDTIRLRALLSSALPGPDWRKWSRVWWGPVPLALALLGIAAGLSGAAAPEERRTIGLGVSLALAGGVLMLGPSVTVVGHAMPLPFAVLRASPASFFRVPERFAVLAAFGTSLLAAAGLEHLRRRLPARAARMVVPAATVAVLLQSGLALHETPLLRVRAAREDAAAYDEVGIRARTLGAGPLIELPPGEYTPLNPEAERRIGQTRHWLPSILDYTGYMPDQSTAVLVAIDRLPDGEALGDLVDMTHLRWLLLRSPEAWGGPVRRGQFYAALSALGVVDRAWSLRNGWLLLRIHEAPKHPAWFAAIAAGPHEGFTPLGTPLRLLERGAALGRVAVQSAPREVSPAARVRLQLAVTNLGDAAWPAIRPFVSPATYFVQLHARWVPDGAPPNERVPVQTFELRRDLPPGESLHQDITLAAPATPGAYQLEIVLAQADGPVIASPDAGTVRLPIEVR